MSEESKAVEESAKAVQEVAKVATVAVEAAKDGAGWLDGIIGDGLRNFVALHWTDRLSARRVEAAIYDYARLEEIRHKVLQKLKRKGVDAIRLAPPKIVIPLIESATMEDEPSLRELWSNLLTSALDPAASAIERKFVSTLNDLSKDDAIVLADLYRQWQHSAEKEFLREPFSADGVEYEGGGLDADQNNISIVTLNRLGLIRPTYLRIRSYQPPSHHSWGDDEGKLSDPLTVAGDLSVVRLTRYGFAFCNAVIGPNDTD